MIDSNKPDRLVDIFRQQKELMEQLALADKLPEAPIDITTKSGQRMLKELIWAMVEEMAEASYVLKNRSHKFTDARDVDVVHFREELADALAFFIEICVFAGIDAEGLYIEYTQKHNTVMKRVVDGY